MSIRILGVIPARGGSKGVPRKNIRPLGGIPLIAHTIRCARACGLFTDIVTSTDDPEIQSIAIEYGSQAPFLRPAELATDTALAIPMTQHAVSEMEMRTNQKYDIIALLQPTSPLKTPSDLTEALTRLMNSKADAIISVVHVNNWHPWKMKKLVDDLLVDYEKPPIDNPPRQSLPPVYMVNGVLYATRRDVLMNENTFKGKTCLGYMMPEERSANIDSEVDFMIAEYFYHKAKGLPGT